MQVSKVRGEAFGVLTVRKGLVVWELIRDSQGPGYTFGIYQMWKAKSGQLRNIRDSSNQPSVLSDFFNDRE